MPETSLNDDGSSVSGRSTDEPFNGTTIVAV